MARGRFGSTAATGNLHERMSVYCLCALQSRCSGFGQLRPNSAVCSAHAGRSGEAAQFPPADIDIRGGYSRFWVAICPWHPGFPPTAIPIPRRTFKRGHGSERDGRDVPQPEIQTSRFSRRSTSLYFWGERGEHYNTNPWFQAEGGSACCRWREEAADFWRWSATRGAVCRAIRAALVAS